MAPEVVAYLSPHIDGSSAIEFVLANGGRGPAFRVQFHLSYDKADLEAHHVHLLNDDSSLDKIERHLSTIARQSVRFSAIVDTTQIEDRFIQRTKGNPDETGPSVK